MRTWKRIGVAAALAASLWTGAAAATTSVEMLREMFNRPVTEWKQELKNNSRLLNDDFFSNVSKRIRWGMENNHVDDAFRFAMVGDFAAEAVNRPATYRIDLAEAFFKDGNTIMPGQIADNIIISSPDTEEARRAQFLRGRLFETAKDLFNAYMMYKALADQKWQPADTWLKCGEISLLIGEEKRGLEELGLAAAAGSAEAEDILAKYKARDQDWNSIPALPNQPGDQTFPNTDQTPTAPSLSPTSGETTAPPAVPSSEVSSSDPLAMARDAMAHNHLSEGISMYAALFDPNDPQVCREYGAALYRSGDLKTARQIFDQALARHGNDVELLRGRANTLERMYDRQGDKATLAAAIADYQKAASLDPDHQLLSWELARAQAKK
jgi:tetratricopeptide (TPR) repeat protein